MAKYRKNIIKRENTALALKVAKLVGSNNLFDSNFGLHAEPISSKSITTLSTR